MMEQCDCINRAPTYPTYRETIHLPDCPWFRVEMLQKCLNDLVDLLARQLDNSANTQAHITIDIIKARLKELQ